MEQLGTEQGEVWSVSDNEWYYQLERRMLTGHLAFVDPLSDGVPKEHVGALLQCGGLALTSDELSGLMKGMVFPVALYDLIELASTEIARGGLSIYEFGNVGASTAEVILAYQCLAQEAPVTRERLEKWLTNGNDSLDAKSAALVTGMLSGAANRPLPRNYGKIHEI